MTLLIALAIVIIILLVVLIFKPKKTITYDSQHFSVNSADIPGAPKWLTDSYCTIDFVKTTKTTHKKAYRSRESSMKAVFRTGVYH